LDLLTVRDAFVIVVRVVAEAYIFDGYKKRNLLVVVASASEKKKIKNNKTIHPGRDRVQTARIADSLASRITADLLEIFPLSERKRFHGARPTTHLFIRRALARPQARHVRGLDIFRLSPEGTRS
jgi:hypothetical protein